jgi:small subunit ribosomal protein S17e
MNRIKRISTELLEKYPNKFGLEFDANKKVLNEVAVVTSKVLRNEIAGYITSHLRKQAAQEKASSAMAGDETEEVEEAPELE